MKYDIITDLTESKLIVSKSRLKKFTAKDIADITFLYFLLIEILINEYAFAPRAVNYAKRTLQYGGKFDNFRFGTSDLYLLLHVLLGKNNQDLVKLLKGEKEANKLLLDNITANTQLIRRYLMFVKRNKLNNAFTRRFFLQLQKGLMIDRADYRNLRILVSSWRKLNKHRKRLVITRMLQFFRFRALRSELLPLLIKMAKDQKLEIKGVDNAETGKEGKMSQADQKEGKTPWWLKAAIVGGSAIAGYKLARRKKE